MVSMQQFIVGYTPDKLKVDLSLSASEEAVVSIVRLGHRQEQSRSELMQFEHKLSNTNENLYRGTNLSTRSNATQRAQLLDMSMDGAAVRIGSSVYVTDNLISQSNLKKVGLSKLSLCLDHLERKGHYLFVTSRSKLDSLDEKSKSDKPRDRLVEATNSLPSSDEFADSDDTSISEPESELSAYESWSEASTDHDEVTQISETAPLYLGLPGKVNGESDNSSDSDDSDAPSPETDSSDDDSSDSDGSVVEAVQLRYDVHTDYHEGTEMITAAGDSLWDGPDGFSDDEDDYYADAGYDDEDFVIEIDDVYYVNNHDNTEPDESDEDDKKNDGLRDDTDKKSNEGKDSDDNKKLAGDGPVSSNRDDNLPKDRPDIEIQHGELTDTTKDRSLPVGSPVAQLQVYDLSLNDSAPVFRFKRQTGSPIHSSPPAIHPFKSLIVWPVGDNTILCADYTYKSYFLRKLRPSRLMSKHVSITPCFSKDGNFLHVAVLEQRIEAPKKSRKVSKKEAKETAEKDGNKRVGKGIDGKQEETPPEYDLVLNTYILSKHKTTRAPPTLSAQTKVSLGRLKTIPPTLTWTTDYLFISCTCSKLTVFRVKLIKSPMEKAEVMTLRTPAMWKGNAEGREVHYLPATAELDDCTVVFGPATSKLNNDRNASRDEIQLVANSETNGQGTIEADVEDKGDMAWSDSVMTLHFHEQLDFGGWYEITDASIGKLAEGVGQMEVDAVPMDTTDDCDCE